VPQRLLADNQSTRGSLADREKQLVSDIIQLQSEADEDNDNSCAVEALLSELRVVRQQLREMDQLTT